jgi:hypothetical protein
LSRSQTSTAFSGIARGESIEHVVDHLARDPRHFREQGQRFDVAAILDHGNPLGDVLGIVADPLDHAGNLERCHHFPKIVSHRRAKRYDLDGVTLDFAFQLVDLLVVLDHPPGGFAVPLDERAHRLVDGRFGKAAHFGDEAAQLVELAVEGFDGMRAGR